MVEVFEPSGKKPYAHIGEGTFHNEKLCALYNSKEFRPNQDSENFPHWHCYVKNDK